MIWTVPGAEGTEVQLAEYGAAKTTTTTVIPQLLDAVASRKQ